MILKFNDIFEKKTDMKNYQFFENVKRKVEMNMSANLTLLTIFQNVSVAKFMQIGRKIKAERKNKYFP